MALENPLPPKHFRDINGETLRRSLRSSSDRIQDYYGIDDEGSIRASSKIDMKQLVSAGKVCKLNHV